MDDPTSDQIDETKKLIFEKATEAFKKKQLPPSFVPDGYDDENRPDWLKSIAELEKNAEPKEMAHFMWQMIKDQSDVPYGPYAFGKDVLRDVCGKCCPITSSRSSTE